jgi:hypothetical protein
MPKKCCQKHDITNNTPANHRQLQRQCQEMPCQGDNQEDNAAGGINAVDSIRAIDSNKVVNKAVNNVKATDATRAAKAINDIAEIKAINAIKNAKGNFRFVTLQHFSTA